MYSLTFVHGIPCMPSLISLPDSMGALFILPHAAIQVVYCHYVLTPFVKFLSYVKFWHLCLKARRLLNTMKDQRTSYGAEDKRSLLKQILV